MPRKKIQLTEDDFNLAMKEFLENYFPGEMFKKTLIRTPWLIGEITWSLNSPGVHIELETEWKLMEKKK